jgi:hypothetical protein
MMDFKAKISSLADLSSQGEHAVLLIVFPKLSGI